MSEKTGPFAWLSKLTRLSMLITLSLMLASIIAAAGLLYRFRFQPDQLSLPIIILLVFCLLAMPAFMLWVIVMYGAVSLTVSKHSEMNESAARLDRLETLIQEQVTHIRELADMARLSDQAKSLIYRDREIEAVREAIHSDIVRQDYKSAEALVAGLAARADYADEAARLKQEIDLSRKATLAEKVETAIGHIQKIMDNHDWSSAVRQAERLMGLFPDNAKVASLRERIRTGKAQHKRGLLQAYGEAVKKNDVDQSILLLRELDAYLTPQEGAALQDSARGVFKAKLHQLGVQFAIRVTDELWPDAIAAGESIIREFPNTRMAQEVREKMDNLRARAAAAKGN